MLVITFNYVGIPKWGGGILVSFLCIFLNFKQKDNKEIVHQEIETLGLRKPVRNRRENQPLTFDIQLINDPFIIYGQLLQHKKYVDKI